MDVLVGLGGNLGDVLRTFAVAHARLAQECPIRATSSLWRSAPVGPAQPEFHNAAVRVDWRHHPLQLLAVCQAIEAEAGRDRRLELRWGPRTLDLDILIARGVVASGPSLSLPHPRLHERRFALLPAVELAPTWVHPGLHVTLGELSSRIDPATQACTRVGEFPG